MLTDTIGVSSQDALFVEFKRKCVEKYPHCEELGGVKQVVLPLEEELSSIHKSSYGFITE